LASVANAFAEEDDAGTSAGEHALIIGFTRNVSKRFEKVSSLNTRQRANAGRRSISAVRSVTGFQGQEEGAHRLRWIRRSASGGR